MKKGLIIAAAMILAVCLGVGGTLAYLFVTSGPVVNTFSPSNITLDLKETTTDYQMIPGKDIAKDPKVTASADVPFYVFVKVDKTTAPDADTYLEYTISSEWTPLEGVTGVYYKSVDSAKGGALTDVPVLTNNKVTTREEITKEQMKALKDSGNYPKLTFTAYAIQKDGFDTAAAAWTQLKTQYTIQ